MSSLQAVRRLPRRLISQEVNLQQPAVNFVTAWGKWSGKRELVRGFFHASIGIIGWVLLQPVQLDSDLMTFLLCTVSFAFIVLEAIRLAANKWHNTDYFTRLIIWINNRLVKEFLTRDIENHQQTTVIPSVLGLFTAWAIAPRWICVVVTLYFGFIDPLAKLGKYWPIRVFKTGRAKGKSVGGLLFGMLGGLIGLLVVLLVNFWIPILPREVTFIFAAGIFLVGLLSASFFELFGGKIDNFLIPAGSALVMTALNQLFCP